MDNVDRATRSRIMSRIRSKRTGPEMRLHGLLKGLKMRHRMWPGGIPGSPDVVLIDPLVIVWVHGCFWHGCRWHFRGPKTNRKFWTDKIEVNKNRDRRNRIQVGYVGIRHLTIWEHDLRAGAVKRDKITAMIRKAAA